MNYTNIPTTMCRLFILVLCVCACSLLRAQNIPQHISYTQIYEFIDELASEHIIDLNTSIKPYSRDLIARKLQEVQAKESHLTERQRKELDFYINDYALELDTIPHAIVNWTNKKTFSLGLLQPAFHYGDEHFKCRILPILGMDLIGNQNGMIMKKWWGAEFQADIVNHISVWASLRDNSLNGNYLKDDLSPIHARLTAPSYLNTHPGYQYKEAAYGGDFSDMRGGIKAYTWWGSIGIQKDNVIWGDSYHSSNIMSGRAPSFPAITLSLTPVRWFELNYMHASLISNVLDSTTYYIENAGTDTEKKHYRPQNKFMSSMMLNFSPIKHLNIGIGSSIIYAERTMQLAYLLPIALHKSLDHQLTKGLRTENQNSQIFLTLSTRNLKHLHLYASFFVDEIKFSRFKPSNPQTNPISYQAGFNLTNWPLQNVSLKGEYTFCSIATYTHSIEPLTWASNSYNMGHYLGDNAQEFYIELEYKPIRGLDLSLSYINAQKGRSYDYLRSNILEIISQKPLDGRSWTNSTLVFDAVYEVFNNAYARINMEYNNAQGYDLESLDVEGENLLGAQGYLDKFTPKFYQGKNLTVTCGFGFNF